VRLDDFASRDAVEAWVDIQEKLANDDLREPIVAGFREFGQDYETLVGERDDKGGKLSEFQVACTSTSRRLATPAVGPCTTWALARLRAAGATLAERRTLADLDYVMAGAPARRPGRGLLAPSGCRAGRARGLLRPGSPVWALPVSPLS